MAREITRRDFLNGTQVAIGASLLGACSKTGGLPLLGGGDPEPPARTGMRGSHDGSWETMHARLAGRSWPAGEPEEHFDLVVVGGGISGLSAAHFYRKTRPAARVLVLDNHDDFGGHAKRNEFQVGSETRIGYGGTESIDTPSAYSRVAKDLLVELGIDTQKFYRRLRSGALRLAGAEHGHPLRRGNLRGAAARGGVRGSTVGGVRGADPDE